jgi:hypothetical protein
MRHDHKVAAGHDAAVEANMKGGMNDDGEDKKKKITVGSSGETHHSLGTHNHPSGDPYKLTTVVENMNYIVLVHQ